MDSNRLFLVSDVPGYSPQFGRLISMMNFTRATTFDQVRNLTTEQLDYFVDEKSNSIGALLMHIAAIEVLYQVHTFENRDYNVEEQKEWAAARHLGEQARNEIKGKPIEYYLQKLREVRANTLKQFAKLDDEWLYEETPFWGGKPANNYFKWFHVFEDELSHRGQIKWLKSRIPEMK